MFFTIQIFVSTTTMLLVWCYKTSWCYLVYYNIYLFLNLRILLDNYRTNKYGAIEQISDFVFIEKGITRAMGFSITILSTDYSRSVLMCGLWQVVTYATLFRHKPIEDRNEEEIIFNAIFIYLWVCAISFLLHKVTFMYIIERKNYVCMSKSVVDVLDHAENMEIIFDQNKNKLEC